MKHFLLFISLLLVLGVSAQTLHVEAHENNLSSSDLWTEMVTEIKVENISQSNTVEVSIRVEADCAFLIWPAENIPAGKFFVVRISARTFRREGFGVNISACRFRRGRFGVQVSA